MPNGHECMEKYLMGFLAAMIKIVDGILIGNLYVYMAEIFPSVYRAIGVSFCIVIGRIGNILAPLICNYLIQNSILPHFSFGVFSILGIFVALLSPETFGLGLTETIGSEPPQSQQSLMTVDDEASEQLQTNYDDQSDSIYMRDGTVTIDETDN